MAQLVSPTSIPNTQRLTALFAAILIGLAGCGGNPAPTAAGLTLNGAGQKGPYLAGGTVTAYKLEAGSTRTASSKAGSVEANGLYTLHGIDWTGLTEIAVTGLYYDEAADADSIDTLELVALVDVQGPATARVNLFTHLLAARVRALMAAGDIYAEARAQALTDMSAQFGLDFAGGIGPESLDLTDGAGANRRGNANLLLFSAATLAAGHGSQAAVNAMRDDFADNGHMDAAGQTAVRRAGARLNLDTLRARLMARSATFADPPASADLSLRPAWVLADLMPNTGIRANQCYAAGSSDLMDCTGTAAIALSDQQDGMIAPGAEGFAYSLVAKADGGTYDKTECVRDDITGLVWEGKSDSGLRAGGNRYTNYHDQYAGTTEQMLAASNTYGYVSYVNSVALCGHADWRLPTADELLGLVDYGVARPGPTMDAAWFHNGPPGLYYWSSSPYVGVGDYAWLVTFNDGGTGYQDRDLNLLVRLVRASH